MKKISLVLIDNLGVIKVECHLLLGKVEDIEIIGECATLTEAINMVKESLPDMVILEAVYLYTTAVELIQLFKKYSPKTRFLILTSHINEEVIRELLEAGILAFVAKEDLVESLVPAIRSAMNGKIYLSPTVQKNNSGPSDVSETS